MPSTQAVAEKNMHACTSDLIMYHYKHDAPAQWEGYCTTCADHLNIETKASDKLFSYEKAPQSSMPAWSMRLQDTDIPIPVGDYFKIHFPSTPNPMHFGTILQARDGMYVLIVIEKERTFITEGINTSSGTAAWETTGVRELFDENTDVNSLMLDSLAVERTQISCRYDQRMTDARNLYRLAFRPLWDNYTEYHVFPNRTGYLAYKKGDKTGDKGRHYLNWVYISGNETITITYAMNSERLAIHIADIIAAKTPSNPTEAPQWLNTATKLIEVTTHNNDTTVVEIDDTLKKLEQSGLDINRH